MDRPTLPSSRGEPLRSLPVLAAFALLVGLCYANTLRVPFLLDDPRPGEPLAASTRPLVAASFALNRALSGDETWSFHAFNALVHLLSGAALYAVLRGAATLAAPGLAARTRDGLAFVTTALWLCHPLQTAAITYLCQRAEAMAVLFYLLFFYCFLRAASAPRPLAWQALALSSLALGFATKEILVTAPVLAWLFDATFLAGGPLRALRRRPGFYATLAAATFVLLAVFVLPILHRTDSTAGFLMPGLGPLAYLRTEPGVLLHYLRLVFWPHPLCFDYAWPIAKEPSEYLPQSLLVLLLLGAALVLTLRRSWVGFVGLAFFLVLAPTSSVVPIQDPAFEHRMYAPLAAPLFLAVCAVARGRERMLPARARLSVVAAALALLASIALTVRRNQDFASARELWRLTAEQAPHSSRAHANYGAKLLDEERAEAAVPVLLRALTLNPYEGWANLNLGNAFLALGAPERALPFLERAREQKRDVRCHAALGRAYAMQGEHALAAECFARALELLPDDERLEEGLARALELSQRADEALAHYRRALELAPENDGVRARLVALVVARTAPQELAAALTSSGLAAPAELDRAGRELFQRGDAPGAAAQFQAAVALAPRDAGLHHRLASALAGAQRNAEALEHDLEAVRLEPRRLEARMDAAALLLEAGRAEESVAQCRAALELAPGSAEVRTNLAQGLRALGRYDEALEALREAMRLAPELPEPRAALARTVGLKSDASAGERREALECAERANRMTNGTRPDLLEVWAEVLAREGRFAEAAQHLDEALRLPGPSRNATFAARLRAAREDYLRRAGE